MTTPDTQQKIKEEEQVKAEEEEDLNEELDEWEPKQFKERTSSSGNKSESETKSWYKITRSCH